MKTAFLFPGQGVDVVPLVGDWVAEGKDELGILDQAENATGYQRQKWLSHGGRLLQKTEILQPVLTAVNLLIDEKLQQAGIRPDLTAGHSLGEIAAWASAGGINRHEAVTAAAARGLLMARQAARSPGGMLALTGVDREFVDLILTGDYEVDLAAHNAPGEWILAGGHAALKAVRARHGGRLLEVAGPWHARSMASEAASYQAILESPAATALAAGLVVNRHGKLVEDFTHIPTLLAGQLSFPIAWVSTMKTMHDNGIVNFVIPGSGKILRGLVRQCLGATAIVHLIQTPADLKRFVDRQEKPKSQEKATHEPE